jgi:hypothetical protein
MDLALPTLQSMWLVYVHIPITICALTVFVVLYMCFAFVWFIPHPAVILTNFGSMEYNICMYVCMYVYYPGSPMVP